MGFVTEASGNAMRKGQSVEAAFFGLRKLGVFGPPRQSRGLLEAILLLASPRERNGRMREPIGIAESVAKPLANGVAEHDFDHARYRHKRRADSHGAMVRSEERRVGK